MRNWKGNAATVSSLFNYTSSFKKPRFIFRPQKPRPCREGFGIVFQPCGGLKVVEANLSLSKNNIVQLVILLKLYGQTRQKKKNAKCVCLL